MADRSRKPFVVHFFWGKGCPHCADEKPVLDEMKKRFPRMMVKSHEVWDVPERRRLRLGAVRLRPEKDVLRNWHGAFSKIDKDLKKNGKIEESKMVTEVMKRGLETAYNYYHVEAVQVREKAGTMTFLLVFYVVYTMWWGFAIYYLFDAIGLTMSKAQVKKEV